MTSPILEGTGSLSDRIFQGLTSQGFTVGTISDRERARLLAKLGLVVPQNLSMIDLYELADEPARIWGVGQVGGGTIENALLNPSAFGWPDATNTGTSGELSAEEPGGIDVVTDGTVIENRQINGVTAGYGLFINANNVTIRNCRIWTTPGPAGGCIVVAAGRTGVVIEDNELFYIGQGTFSAAIGAGEAPVIMRRNNIHDVSEGPRVHTGCIFEDNYVHDIIGDDPGAHADLIQSLGGDNIVIDHNTFVATFAVEPANAVAILGSEAQACNGLRFRDNLIGGVVGASPGFSLMMGPTNPYDDAIVSGNRWGRDQYDFGPTAIEVGITNFTWTNNVFDDDNEVIPLVEEP